MIRIYKDNDVKLVTQGTYKNLYEPLGYKIIIEAKAKEVTKEPAKVEEVVEEPVAIEDSIDEEPVVTEEIIIPQPSPRIPI